MRFRSLPVALFAKSGADGVGVELLERVGNAFIETSGMKSKENSPIETGLILIEIMENGVTTWGEF